MTLFKKKKQKPAIIYTLELELQKAREQKLLSFYYPLWEHEVKLAQAWALRNRMWTEPDHVTDGNTFYKFYGYKL